MKLSLSKYTKDFSTNTSLVVFVPNVDDLKKGKSNNPSFTPLPELGDEFNSLLKEAVTEGSFSGNFQEIIMFRLCKKANVKNFLAVGLGGKSQLNPEGLRVAGAVAYNAIKSAKIKNAHFHLASAFIGQKDHFTSFQALAEGILLADYTMDDYKYKEDKKKAFSGIQRVYFVAPSKAKLPSLKKSLETAEVISQAVNFARRLGDLPGNLMTPDILAKEAVKAAKGIDKLKVTVWDKATIKKEKMGGLYGVSTGSGNDPRFIIMDYIGGAKTQKPLIFIGKGLTFDSGGISIKHSTQMDDMRYDMCGGSNVIATILAIAKLGLKVNVMGMIPASENMPGPMANKPGDILTIRNGKTVEVLNTDAEGRLILADALVYASEKKPLAIIDAATLTGAIVVALGNLYTGYFTRDELLNEKIKRATQNSGELVWPMPIHERHVSDMKGNFADYSNISSSKGASSSTAAAFLSEFVEKGIPWAHFDVAGTAWFTGDRFPYNPKKGASGVMIRTFVELAKTFH